MTPGTKYWRLQLLNQTGVTIAANAVVVFLSFRGTGEFSAALTITNDVSIPNNTWFSFLVQNNSVVKYLSGSGTVDITLPSAGNGRCEIMFQHSADGIKFGNLGRGAVVYSDTWLLISDLLRSGDIVL